MDKLAKELNIEYKNENKYASIIVALSELEEVDLSEIRGIIEKYLYSLEIQNLNINIAKYLLPNVHYEDISQEFIDKRELSDLTDFQLLRYLVVVLKTISWVQKDNLLVLKYSKNIWNTGWHNLAKQCRGKVIDLNERTIVSYPFNKFYNLNEVEETKIDRVQFLIDNAKEIIVTDKKDGSAIIVTNYKGNIIINTNGEFNNIQVILAKKLFEKKYKHFYKNMPEGLTFVFELIHPDNRIVLDYGDTEKLYLLAIRDLTTLRLYNYNEMKNFAEKWELDITECYDFNSLTDLVQIAESECKNIKEGWVIRVITDTEDFIFKLKYREYFKLARIKSIPSLKKLYILLEQDKLDDMLSVAEEAIKSDVEGKIQIIFDYIDKIKHLVEQKSNILLEKYEVERGNIPKDKWLKILSEVRGNVLSSLILKYLRSEEIFKKLPSNVAFEKYYYYINELYGIEEDLWNSSEKQVEYGQV